MKIGERLLDVGQEPRQELVDALGLGGDGDRHGTRISRQNASAAFDLIDAAV